MAEVVSDKKKDRPEYGEYATPQDQARAMGASYGPAGTPTADHVEKPEKGARSTSCATRKAAQDQSADDADEKHPRLWDAALTVAFLTLGVVIVITTIPQWADLFDFMNTAYAQLGYDPYTSRQLAESIGMSINLMQVVALTAAITLSVRALRAGRIAFYIPIAVGAVALVITFVLFLVATALDPAMPTTLPLG